MCNHDEIETRVDLDRLTETEGGPVISFKRPIVSMDGYTLRAPLGPASSTSAPIDLLIPTGVDA